MTKELIRTFDWSDYKEDREYETEERVMGRTYVKLGQYTATTLVGNLYKVDDPSEKSFNYLLLVGVARQHPNDRAVTYKEGVETANVNANVSPVITMKLQNPIEWDDFVSIAHVYVASTNMEFVRTADEIRLAKMAKNGVPNE